MTVTWGRAHPDEAEAAITFARGMLGEPMTAWQEDVMRKAMGLPRGSITLRMRNETATFVPHLPLATYWPEERFILIAHERPWHSDRITALHSDYHRKRKGWK